MTYGDGSFEELGDTPKLPHTVEGGAQNDFGNDFYT
jgi:hypothetical protein